MIFVIGNINGSVKIYHNETNYLKSGASNQSTGGTGDGTGGGIVFDDCD
jgi:hypothetical protein